MSTIIVLNTSSDLTSKTVLSAENPYTITGLHTFDRDPAAPFAVTSGSAAVTNLDADKLDGLEGAAYATLTGANIFTNNQVVTANSSISQTVNGTAGYTVANASAGASASSALTFTNSADTAIVELISTAFTGFPSIGNRSVVIRAIQASAPSICGMAFTCEHNSVLGGTYQWFSRGIAVANLVMTLVPSNVSGGIGTTGNVLKLVASDNGNACVGNLVYVGRNNNATSAFSGAIQMEDKAGVAWALWVDAAGKLRIGTAPPGSGISDTSGTIVGTQS